MINLIGGHYLADRFESILPLRLKKFNAAIAKLPKKPRANWEGNELAKLARELLEEGRNLSENQEKTAGLRGRKIGKTALPVRANRIAP